MTVVSFPAASAKTGKSTRRTARPMTLFVHIRRCTLIMHIADSSVAATADRAEAN